MLHRTKNQGLPMKRSVPRRKEVVWRLKLGTQMSFGVFVRVGGASEVCGLLSE